MLKGGGDIPVPTPVYEDGLVIITNAHGQGRPIYAIKTDASGDITGIKNRARVVAQTTRAIICRRRCSITASAISVSTTGF